MLGFGGLALGLGHGAEIYRLAAKTAPPTSVAISTVSVGFVGFLVGPVLLGVIAKFSALWYSYVFLLGSVLSAWGIILPI